MSRISVEKRKLRERRTIAATVGYCFVIVLVVLLVMSNILTGTYTELLQSERADTMESLAVASSAALGHTELTEGMDYPLTVYEYDDGKPYIISIYTKTTDSFRLLYTSAEGGADQYLSGVGEAYINCFEMQNEAFTKRTVDGKEYVCAIAPIISSENTVAGIIEFRMPMSDFTATVNGMSLSWIFTIFSIAISMGIMIFELNLLITTLSQGVVSNVPVLIMYGDNAVRFLSFFMALGAVMPGVVISTFMKDHLKGESDLKIHLMIAVTIFLYSIGLYCFSGVRKILKFKLTGRIALITVTVFGYLLSLICGLADNAYAMLILILPIAFCCGMPLDALRDYRINAGRLGYKDFDDRHVHNLQFGSYFLGVSVGTVVAGICYERFGLLIVSIISGAVLVFTALGIIYFMKNNTPVKESSLTFAKWLELASDKYTGRFMLSTFVILGVVLAFYLAFVPNFLETVGISLATTSFYYLLAAFSACVLGTVIKSRYAHILTSKVRVIISSTSALLGLAIFALLPTAKVLCISCVLLGISLGIHDFYYIYVLYLLSAKRIKANLRKASEIGVISGFSLAIVIFAVALITSNIRMIFLVTLVVFFLCGYIYPMSSFSNDVDDKDPTLRKRKKRPVAEAEKPSSDVLLSSEQPSNEQYTNEVVQDVPVNGAEQLMDDIMNNMPENYSSDQGYYQQGSEWNNGMNSYYDNNGYYQGGDDNGSVE